MPPRKTIFEIKMSKSIEEISRNRSTTKIDQENGHFEKSQKSFFWVTLLVMFRFRLISSIDFDILKFFWVTLLVVFRFRLIFSIDFGILKKQMKMSKSIEY